MNYWLIKSEENCYSIDNLKSDKVTPWEGVRNFQARNFMLNDMKKGDMALFYHSNGDPSGIVGVAKVCSSAHPDMSALNKDDEHFDRRSTKEKPIWFCVDFCFVKKFKKVISLEAIKKDKILNKMVVARRGNRLSISPVSKNHFDFVIKLSK